MARKMRQIVAPHAVSEFDQSARRAYG